MEATNWIYKAISLCICIVLFASLPLYADAQGTSYCVINAETLEVLEQSDMHKRLEMASTTKIMTAIVVLENIPIDQTVEILDEYCAVEGSSMHLRSGEIYSVKDLLMGLMLCSGNDAAIALACAVAGSASAFVRIMNEKARQLKLEDTSYNNPHGLHDKHHFTSAYDLAILCSYAMRNSEFCSIVSSKKAVITDLNSQKTRTVYNKNKFLDMLEGADGIKIGYTTKAGRCLCASASKGEKRLICVIINHYDWFDKAVYLLKKYF